MNATTESPYIGIAQARAGDPESSHEAAARTERTGIARSQRLKVLDEVMRIPGLTSAEIAANLGMDRYTPSRRLPELRARLLVRNGPSRVCQCRGSIATTWFPL